ncbi:sodium/potassium-transporting ATPase subunit beta-1-like [Acanthaster planci]|uniref:Sodium/potassium-transporting ATPase subunit beta-1-like n=1 Tax=Acanthaster planci TaxID=133434 RepID=A0A8B7YJI4_ACAPL|nr:sodium/potassium-transporting ATPase subunit beta-1-like [Acanthaster planci]
MGGEDKPTFRQKVRTNWAAFRIFLWNSEKREFLGRNAKSWGQIGIFYLILYICLAGFWALMLFIFMQTVSPDHPTYNSYVNVPGVTLRPKFYKGDVVFNPEVPESYKDEIEDLKKIWNSLAPENQTDEVYVDCLNDTAPDGKFCRFDREVLGPCRPPMFGWDEGSPCLFISLNRVSEWIPEDYDEDSVPDVIKDVYEPGNIAFHCMDYKNKYDYSNNTIYPSAGIPFNYYPFVGTTDEDKRAHYIQPYVAVQFDLNVMDKKIKVQCRAYAGNLSPLGGLFDIDYVPDVVYEFVLSTKSKEEL